ncbi:hypothetical protein GLOIN_2v1762226 [Rhizophagus clarus]|uniref:F-box domain-containing protein n=1 Tax=Rhizophagus clarus TaxID=94130 RepID=A0A8H3QGU5_9GLOM|nr:hypothetical protein GLOIN_2v1762226 [Rhizophagus clarus]
MTCSKLFSGDLPELTDEIIQHFRDDHNTLYSCTLVNRLWCRLAIPLLWEDPFLKKSLLFIEIYLRRLNDDDNDKLKEYWNIDNPYSNTLFNYPSFIKRLNTKKFISSIEKLSHQLIKGEFSIMDSNKLARLICDLLFKLFVENEANLHTFEFEMINDYSFITVELLLKSLKFICNMKNIELFNLRMAVTDDDEANVQIEDFIIKVFRSQQNIKKILFEHVEIDEFQPTNNPILLSLSLSLLKESNCSNTLNRIIFFETDFKDIDVLNEAFEELNVLESVHILYCYNINSDFIQQIIDLSKPFKLKSLFMKEKVQHGLLQLLLQKSGNYLENIGFESSMYKMEHIKHFTNYCTNIKFFKLYRYNNQIISPSLNLIKNIEKTLNYLSIDFHRNNHVSSDDIKLSSTIFLKLGNFLPPRLEYLENY